MNGRRLAAWVMWVAVAACGDGPRGAADAAVAEVEVEVAPEVGSDIEVEVDIESEVESEVEVEVDTGPPAPLTLLTVTGNRPEPADLVFARLEGDGLGHAVSLGGLRRGHPVFLDRDEPADMRFPFAVVVRAAGGQELFRSTLREPIQIREFLAIAHVTDLIDVFAIFPELGDFVTPIPSDLPADAHIRFERRELDQSTTLLGDFVLGAIPEMAPNPFAGAPHTLLAGGADPADALDIVILGDGYTADEQARFQSDADMVAAQFAATQPYARYAQRVNVHRVDVVSHESGASYDCAADVVIPGCRDALRDTAFGSVFPLRIAALVGQNASDRALLQRNQWEVAQAASVVPYDAVVVIVNTPKYGGFGLFRASVANTLDDLAETAVHEFGHAFALLGDEYFEPGDICQHYPLTPDYPNLSVLTDSAATVPWAAWLPLGVPLPTDLGDAQFGAGVGFFEGGGGGCTDLYRPVAVACLMLDYGYPLCPVCREQTLLRIFGYGDVLGPGLVQVENTTLVADAPSEAIAGEWLVDDVVVGPAADAQGRPLPLDLAALPGGAATRGVHAVTLRVWPLSDFIVRPEAITERVRLTVDYAPPEP